MTNRTAPSSTAAEPPGLLELPAGVLELLELPALEGLRDDQARGQDCCWCGNGPLTTETCVDLGQQTSRASGTVERWYPRACRPCTGTRAYSALLDHSPTCTECRTAAPGCEVGRTLNRLVREGRQR